MRGRKTIPEKAKFEITIRAEVIEDAEDTYTISAESLAVATELAIENFIAEHGRIVDDCIEVETRK